MHGGKKALPLLASTPDILG